ncbi:PhzF family phenazine biosynthesis protein [Flavobacterium sp. RSSA_27]|uniref:PhzF family phenazine biosynthesis protein n=1 Tax=Flavobacterium sp. RSSA_27 TaxID=3447667 RepID=UPI003F2F24FE
MKLDFYQIDAFTDTLFGGNPAVVVPLQEWLPDALLLKITQENAVAETAFFVDKGEKIHLRWFTPEIEMDLCGHATLATVHALKTILNDTRTTFVFETLSGELTVKVKDDYYFLDFPSRMPHPCPLPDHLKAAFSVAPKEVLKARDYVLVYDDEETVSNIQIDRNHFDQFSMATGGVIVTAAGKNSDFVSRFFTPQASLLEDPVTGSAHCSLIPLWAERLGKNKLYALQVSERLGKLNCELRDDRVIISGQAKTYAVGSFWTT